ncbi:MAG: dephospho-CoA kinase, partial [Christensenellales bacterium]
MQIIGITGGSGAGKSEVCRILGERGIPIFDADKEYARIAAPNSPCVREIAQAFGDGVIDPDGSLRRRELGAIVFAPGAEDKRRLLNRITHRYVCSAAEAWLRECSARGERFAVIDAPMLFESGLNERCDTVVFVTADRQTRTDRIMRRDGIDEARARARIDAQHDDDFFRSRCDTVIENGRGAELAPVVDALLLSLDRRAVTSQSAENSGRVGSSLDVSASDANSNAAGSAAGFDTKSGNAAGAVGNTKYDVPGNNIDDGNFGDGTASAAGSAASDKSDMQPAPERRGVLARYPL